MQKLNNILSTTTGSKSLISKLCDFREKEKELKIHFMDVAKRITGKDFVITPGNKTVLNLLLPYFTGNGELDINKGIYLYGAYGVGKTVLFKIIRIWIAELFRFSDNGFYSTSIEEIVEYYKTRDSFGKFGFGTDNMNMNICINEFGKPVKEKIYGTEVNELLNSLFMIRYELFQKGLATHVTSNYHPKDLNLEPIIKDRMVEMFNFVELKGESFRK